MLALNLVHTVNQMRGACQRSPAMLTQETCMRATTAQGAKLAWRHHYEPTRSSTALHVW